MYLALSAGTASFAVTYNVAVSAHKSSEVNVFTLLQAFTDVLTYLHIVAFQYCDILTFELLTHMS